MESTVLIREQMESGHGFLEMTLADVTTEQLGWLPPGKANPLGATFAHLVLGEDFLINGMLRGAAPLAAAAFAGKTGLGEMAPAPGQGDWGEWGRRVKIDLGPLRAYAKAVFGATDVYLGALSPADLDRQIDLSALGLGNHSLAWVLTNGGVGHVYGHMGEIACLKGLQGARGYPF